LSIREVITLQDSFLDDRFERGWEAVERRFNQISRTADEIERMEPDERLGVLRELEEIGSRVSLFADNWIHFYLRFTCLAKELGIDAGRKPEEENKPREGIQDDEEIQVTHGAMYRELL
jgi:ribosome assembly protein YihI (activator of Der GTPase)